MIRLKLSLILGVLVSQWSLHAAILKGSRKPDSVIQKEFRLSHARELMGRHYKTSSVRYTENVNRINKLINKSVKEWLPREYRKNSRAIAQTIIDVSLKYKFDPVFVLAVIQGESSFNPVMKGKLDEIGLMQIRPGTGRWISELYKIPWQDAEQLNDPQFNIKVGTAYLDFLRKKFDSHAQLYIAAYNMGQRNVNEALEKNVWPKDYPNHVMRIYVDFYINAKTKNKAPITVSLND